MKTFVALLAAALCVQALDAIDFSKVRPVEVPIGKITPKDKLSVPPPKSTYKNLRAVCGTPNNRNRIVGGVESNVNEFPWQVAVYINGNSFCGGSLISERHVLTAAHCADNALFFDLKFGAHNINTNVPTPVTVRTTQRYVHEQWNSFNLRNDIAILTLDTPITFSDVISPICLPDATFVDPAVGDSVEISGWGRTSDATSGISPVLRKVTVPVMSNADCDAIYGIISDGQICIDTVGGKGSCNGDSGGPLSVVGSDGLYTEVGIVSFGASAGCEAGLPAGFTRVTAYRDWINTAIGV